MSSARPLPLAVDLDGTLCRSNTILEQVAFVLRERPWLIPVLPLWLARGRPAFKAALANVAPLDRVALPYQRSFVAYLEGEAAAGREIVLVTAADRSTASHVASLFPFFREGIGTDGPLNLAGSAKAEYLAKRYGEKGFAYAGNERRDLKVWARAGGAVVVNPSRGLAAAAAKLCSVEKEFDDRPARLPTLLKALRPHQWLKNVLVFVPLLTAHRLADPLALWSALAAFACFCLAASGAYLLNDLVDLPSDRAHGTKKRRPFASGDLPVEWGLVLSPVLLLVAAAGSSFLPVAARVALAVYVAVTLLYSFFFKRVALLDVFVLAGLYALRLLMGHAATGIPFSGWLTFFALCMFLSLALLKRFSELLNRAEGYAPGRGYHVDHRAAILWCGVVSGVAASAIIAAYAGSAHVRTLYSRPEFLYALSPLFLAWILRMWRLGYRGDMHEDPVLFTLHDLFSVGVGAATVLFMLLAR
jgi:4-hydroxybenzoate polyprenyltransferase